MGAAVTNILIGLLCTLALPSSSFTVLPTRAGWVRTRQGYVCPKASDSDEEPDLFEYFDPLLSPHAYPNGISPDQTPQNERVDEEDQERYDPLRLGKHFGSEKNLEDKSVPAPDTFDPTLSPHSYPNGAPSNHAVDEKEEVDLLDVFDPRLSPHMYPNGIPSTNTERSTPVRVGILLMDHGSRNQASNDRLHELAQRYQKIVGSNVVVRAAHMELASPSIPEGLETLLSSNVGTSPKDNDMCLSWD